MMGNQVAGAILHYPASIVHGSYPNEWYPRAILTGRSCISPCLSVRATCFNGKGHDLTTEVNGKIATCGRSEAIRPGFCGNFVSVGIPQKKVPQ